MPKWARLVVGVATVRVALILGLYVSPPAWLGVPPVPPWVYAALASTFSVLGLCLVAGNRRDPRAAWLGGLLTLIGAPFAAPLVDTHAGAMPWLSNVRPEAFIGAFLWYFLTRFPTDLKPGPARVVRRVAAATGLVGLWCAAATLAAAWVPLGDASTRWMSVLLLPSHRDLYWLIVLGIPVPTLPALFLRARAAEGDARRRVRLFTLALLGGIAPFTVEVLVENVWPAYKAYAHSPGVEPWIGAIIFSAIAIVPFVTAYSVLFDRVVEVRVVLRVALQYALARYTIIGVTLVPFIALATYLIEHREESLVSILASGSRPLLIGSVALGLLTLQLRSRWLDALDRRYFREPYDARHILTNFMGERAATSTTEIGARLRDEIDGALHAGAEVFIADDTRSALQHVGDRLPPVGLPATLVDLAMADPQPMDVDLANRSSLLLRLPPGEQRWLERGQFALIVALRSADGAAAGLLALTPKRSGLPYSADDRRLIAAVASAAGLTLDSLRSRGTPGHDAPTEPAARECRECSRLSPVDTAQCVCGGDLSVAAVPHLLRGVFRLEQRIGVGGMSVVYRAVDLNLGRDVAIKALPRVTPDAVTRLRREARAMAALTHPNLAVVYGIEMWQDTLFLVQEYLAGGMLSQRLAISRPPIDEVLGIGVTLAGLLEYMHGTGVEVHCDIKPSNIGFTQYGVIKLLDFGLARVLHDVRIATDAPTTAGVSHAPGSVASDPTARLFGTPEFMSPEAAHGERPSASFDLWALAVVLFEGVSGRRPFEGADMFTVLDKVVNRPSPDIREFRPDTPPAVAAFFDAALARDPARRPASAAAFRASLSRIRGVAGCDLTLPPPSGFRSPHPFLRSAVMTKKKKPSAPKTPQVNPTAAEILDLWLTSVQAGLGLEKKLDQSITDEFEKKFLKAIQLQLDNNNDFGGAKQNTAIVATNLGQICGMLTKGPTVSKATFVDVFTLLRKHPACPIGGGGGGAWCDIGG